jgi:hypothetical protein
MARRPCGRPLRGSSGRQIATDSVELRRTLASCAGPPASPLAGLARLGGARPRRRAPKRKSSGLKLFGMSKCAARTQKNRPCKCLGMRALQSTWVSSPLESVFAKNLGGTPPCPTVEKSENEVRVPKGDAQFGPVPKVGAMRPEALFFSAKSPYNFPDEKERRTGSTLRSKAGPAVAGVSLALSVPKGFP